MTAADLAGASEILGRLARRLDAPGKDGRVRLPIKRQYFGALQQLLRGTEWEGRYCWEHLGAMQNGSWHDADGKFHYSETLLSVDVRPLPRYVACAACGGEGRVAEDKGHP